MSETEPTAGQPGAEPTPPKRPRRRLLPILLILVILLGLAGGGLWWVSGNPHRMPDSLNPMDWFAFEPPPPPPEPVVEPEPEPEPRSVTQATLDAIPAPAESDGDTFPELDPVLWDAPAVTFDPDRSLAALVEGRLGPIEERMAALEREMRDRQQRLADSLSARVTEIRARVEPLAREIEELEARLADLDRVESAIVDIEAIIAEGLDSYHGVLEEAAAHRERTRRDLQAMLMTQRRLQGRLTGLMTSIEGLSSEIHLLSAYPPDAPVVGTAIPGLRDRTRTAPRPVERQAPDPGGATVGGTGVATGAATVGEPPADPEPATEIGTLSSPRWCAGELSVNDDAERYGTVLSIVRAQEGDYVTTEVGTVFVAPCPADPAGDALLPVQ